MTLRRSLEIIRSPAGRLATASLGLCAVILLLLHTGVHAVVLALSHAASFFPWILLLEGAILACSLSALRALYGEDRHRIPMRALVRAGLIGYVVMALVPAGRTAAEAARAALLSRYSSGTRAAAAAAKLQALSLLANAAISIPAMIAVYCVLGLSLPTGLIAINLILTGALGTGILIAARGAWMGAWVGRRVNAVGESGREFDRHFSTSDASSFQAFGWELLGRVLQVLQNGLLVASVGGALGILPAFCSEALHLVGAAAGDLIPAQLGATELSYRFSAAALALRPADSLSIALLAHTSQLFWVAAGILIPATLGSTPETSDRVSSCAPS